MRTLSCVMYAARAESCAVTTGAGAGVCAIGRVTGADDGGVTMSAGPPELFEGVTGGGTTAVAVLFLLNRATVSCLPSLCSPI
jgi:hypothetical protein